MTEQLAAQEPIAASACGKRNAFVLNCPRVGHQRHYAVCLNLIDKRKQGRLDVEYATCSAAIGNKACPALGMRKQEKEAGHALFFKERVRAMGDSLMAKAQEVVGDIIGQRKQPKKVAHNNKSTLTDKIENKGYAEVINKVNAAKVEAKATNKPVVVAVQEPAKPKPVATPIEPLPGESLLEMAKRMMNKDKT